MDGRIALDTNIAIALLAQETGILEALAGAEQVYIPTIVLGELYFGARKSAHVEANIARIDEFAANSAVLGCDAETARYYGEVKNNLRSKGHPLPENDVWLAAIVTQHDLTLISRDAHFKEVEGLRTEEW